VLRPRPRLPPVTMAIFGEDGAVDGEFVGMVSG
jgi:hypothetical protein